MWLRISAGTLPTSFSSRVTPNMNRYDVFCALLLVAGQPQGSLAFPSASTTKLSSRGKFGIDISYSVHSEFKSQQTTIFATKKIILLEREADAFLVSGTVGTNKATYDPLNLVSTHTMNLYDHGMHTDDDTSPICRPSSRMERRKMTKDPLWAPSIALAPLLMGSKIASADEAGSVISKDIMNPASFQPVCPASDNFYRFLQTAVEAIVGRDKFIEYGPLIAGGLLRVRLELCVVESFFNEAVGPFIKENGVSWILPFHETVETFLAGSIFALATTFILVGSTKLLTVITTYFDLLVRNFPPKGHIARVTGCYWETLNAYSTGSCNLIFPTRKGWTSIPYLWWLLLRPCFGQTRYPWLWCRSLQN